MWLRVYYLTNSCAAVNFFAHIAQPALAHTAYDRYDVACETVANTPPSDDRFNDPASTPAVTDRVLAGRQGCDPCHTDAGVDTTWSG